MQLQKFLKYWFFVKKSLRIVKFSEIDIVKIDVYRH